MEKEYVIYKTTNLINDKIYVGKDEYNNPNYLGSGKLLHQAINKYRIDNFLKEIIEICENEEQHSIREVYWINKLDSFSPKGYNILNGSFGGDVYTHHPNKKLYSKRISNTNKGKVRTEKMKEKYSNCKKGRNNPAKQDCVREKISNSRKNKGLRENNSMFNSNRTRDKLNYLDLELKGDRWEYLRNKIKGTNIETNKETIFDGVKEVVETLKISKNKYYSHIKSRLPIKNFILEKL